jgi:hypothetical protein
MVADIGRYQREVTGFLGNVAGVTQAQANTEAQTQGHYIRSSAPLYPESLAMFGPTAASQHRLAYSRSNPYPQPDNALNLMGGLPTFDTRPCASPPGLTAQLGPDASYTADPDFANRGTFDTPQELLDAIKQFAFRDEASTTALPTPACVKQAAQPSLGQIPELSDYTHVYANP